METIFGTDGVRGVANGKLTPELALKLGRAGGHVLSRQKPEKKQFLLGRDTRVSGPMLEGALSAGVQSVGLEVHLGGVLPTPAVAYLCRQGGYAGGAMISASHNPVEDNGIKFFNHEGFKLTDEEESLIEGFLADEQGIPRPTGVDLGKQEEREDLQAQYLRFLAESVEEDLSGLTVVLDTAYGAAWDLAPRAWESLGAKVYALHAQGLGERINQNCGSTHPQALVRAVLEHKAHMGFAYDGDADRVLAVDEGGHILDGDHIMAIWARHLLHRGLLKHNTIAATTYSNRGLWEALQGMGGQILETANGDRHVLEAMVRKGLSLGGEQSGHIIYLEKNSTGDGILTSLQLAGVHKASGQSLGELKKVMKPMPQLLENVAVKHKDWQERQAIKEVIESCAHALQGRGRIFIRASGTEPVIRIMLEGPEKETLQSLMPRLTQVMAKELN